MSHALAVLEVERSRVRTLRVSDFPGVVLADVLAPFGKRTDKVAPLLEGWARTRLEFVAPLQGVSNVDARHKSMVLVHADDVPLLLARLDQRGMSTETKAQHLRFLVACRDALAAHFARPMTQSTDVAVAVHAAVRSALAEALPAMRALLLEDARRLAEGDGCLGSVRAKRILIELRICASLKADDGSRQWRLLRKTFSDEIRTAIGLSLTDAWERLPSSAWPRIQVELERVSKREHEQYSRQFKD